MEKDEIVKILEMVAPGTNLRDSIDDIIRADKGTFIFFVQDPKDFVKAGIIQGGFEINTPFIANRLYELAKMDGAMVVSEDLKTIWYANVHIIPDSSIPTNETGTRHRTAERLAIQTGKLVICISQRRKIVTLYRGNWKYMLNDVSFVVMQMNQGLRLMERYRENFDLAISSLDMKEIEDRVTFFDIFEIVDRGVALLKTAEDLYFYLAELGNAGALSRLHLEELLDNIKDSLELIIMDYANENIIGKEHNPGEVFRALLEKRGDPDGVSEFFGYELQGSQLFETILQPRGYRLLRNIPRIPMSVAKKVIERFEYLSGLLIASFEDLTDVEGVAEKRANAIMSGINSLKNRMNLG